MTATAVRVRLRTYQVGFGDCLLLTITYDSPPAAGDARTVRHVLIDFGTKAGRPGGPDLVDIARAIAEHTDGVLDVVVVTHRHQDHLSGYGNKRAADIIQGLRPKVVVRPWTDVPEATDGKPFPIDLTEKQQALVRSLTLVGDQAELIQAQVGKSRAKNAARAKALTVMAVKNPDAVRRLERWGEGARGHWLQRGDDVDLDDVLPGVGVRVLGPPTIEDAPDLRNYAKASNDYWLALTGAAARADLGAGADGAGLPIAPASPEVVREALDRVAQPQGLGAASWLMGKLQRASSSQVLDMAEGFDDALNNTSLILLVTIGDRSLLLAGDAQGENWAPTLDAASGRKRNLDPIPVLDEELHDQLTAVDLYKVGHHGSRNATPRRLHALWADAGRTPTSQPITSVVSTMSDFYPSGPEGKVPKQELLDALKLVGPVHNTDELPAGVWWFDVEADARGAASFELTMGPVHPVKPIKPRKKTAKKAKKAKPADA